MSPKTRRVRCWRVIRVAFSNVASPDVSMYARSFELVPTGRITLRQLPGIASDHLFISTAAILKESDVGELINHQLLGGESPRAQSFPVRPIEMLSYKPSLPSLAGSTLFTGIVFAFESPKLRTKWESRKLLNLQGSLLVSLVDEPS